VSVVRGDDTKVRGETIEPGRRALGLYSIDRPVVNLKRGENPLPARVSTHSAEITSKGWICSAVVESGA
jgi:hypothetical protein